MPNRSTTHIVSFRCQTCLQICSTCCGVLGSVFGLHGRVPLFQSRVKVRIRVRVGVRVRVSFGLVEYRCFHPGTILKVEFPKKLSKSLFWTLHILC